MRGECVRKKTFKRIGRRVSSGRQSYRIQFKCDRETRLIRYTAIQKCYIMIAKSQITTLVGAFSFEPLSPFIY